MPSSWLLPGRLAELVLSCLLLDFVTKIEFEVVENGDEVVDEMDENNFKLQAVQARLYITP